jgi:hypothetical protein
MPYIALQLVGLQVVIAALAVFSQPEEKGEQNQ